MMLDESPSYFFISVSNRKNLDLCLKYSLAGFTNSINGFWAFLDIDIGDYVSFLYGARAKNLYKVIKKVAYKNAENLPPWEPITFKTSRKTYYFPFRLYLKQERSFDEPMVRPEFSYVAENLLLRGGYRKTHFSADTITLYNVSTMGTPSNVDPEQLKLEGETFTPKIVFNKENQKIPETYYFHELILQSLIRRKIRSLLLPKILGYFGVEEEPTRFEVLGEKALSEGFVDIFIKLKHPTVLNKYIVVEVKTKDAYNKDIKQLEKYLEELGKEAVGGVLIARDFPKKMEIDKKILSVKYQLTDINPDKAYTYQQLQNKLELEI